MEPVIAIVVLWIVGAFMVGAMSPGHSRYPRRYYTRRTHRSYRRSKLARIIDELLR